MSSAFGPNDQLLVFNNAQAAFDKAPSATYFYNTRWRRLGEATMADYGNEVIPQGAGFIVRKIGGTAAFWTNSYPVAATSAVSRKTHTGIATPFDVNLPLSGTPGVECRSGGGTDAIQLVVTFPVAVTYTGASITSGTGTIGAKAARGSTTASSVATVNLTGVTSGQYITVTLAGVSDGVNTNDVAVRIGVLTGDTNGDGSVNSADIGQTKSKSGQIVDLTNFRTDLNTDGNLNSADIGLVKSKSGTALPPP